MISFFSNSLELRENCTRLSIILHKSIFHAALLSFFISINCYSSDTDAVKYFPLKPGNVWVYQTFTNPPPVLGTKRKMYISGDSLISGIKYYKVVNFPWYNGNPPFQLFRVDTTNGNVIQYTSPSCMVIDSLAAEPGNTFSYCGNSNARKCYAIQNFTMFGILLTVKEFEWTQILSAAQRKYAKNIGIISSYYGDIFYNGFSLVGCVIDGIVYGDTSIPVGLKIISTEIPENYGLYQNYPNPFNPKTKIRFNISVDSRLRGNDNVVLSIYNSLGQFIEMLVNQSAVNGLQPGEYQVEWNGSNYPSGLYFYRLHITNSKLQIVFQETRKMLLIK